MSFDQLAAADLQVVVGQKQRLTAQLIHAGFKRNTCARRELLENHAEALAFQMAMRNVVFLFVLELICQVQNVDDIILGAVEQL